MCRVGAQRDGEGVALLYSDGTGGGDMATGGGSLPEKAGSFTGDHSNLPLKAVPVVRRTTLLPSEFMV